jgi:hypothetical protein
MFEQDLRQLNDVLATSPLAGRYWLWGGLLLGWAREGRILAHDLMDADLAYLREDEDRLLESLELLGKAGFHKWFSFQNNGGEMTEHSVVRHGARFDFFRMTPQGNDWEYDMFGCDHAGRPLELTGRITQQPLERFSFLGRSWLKTLDHEGELEVLYGDWRTPNAAWSYLDQGGVVDRQPWAGGAHGSRA